MGAVRIGLSFRNEHPARKPMLESHCFQFLIDCINIRIMRFYFNRIILTVFKIIHGMVSLYGPSLDYTHTAYRD